MGPLRLYIGFLVLAFAYQVSCQDDKKEDEACDDGSGDLTALNGTDNGISALEIKIETEQAQESFNDQLERIINLADQMIQEVNDAHGELAIAGPKVEMDAMQGRDYVVTHSGMIKETAFALWGDGKNVTKMIEDSAEIIMAQDASKDLPAPTTVAAGAEGEEGASEEGAEEGEGEKSGEEEGEGEEEAEDEEEEKRARRQADDDDDDDDSEDGEEKGDDDDDDDDEKKGKGKDKKEDEAGEEGEASGNSTEGNSTMSDPTEVAAPVDVGAEAAKISEMTKTLSKQYNEGLRSIIDETERIKIIYSFQVFNIQNQGEATDETKEDSDDTLGEITVFADKIIESSQKLLESANVTYGFILETAAQIV